MRIQNILYTKIGLDELEPLGKRHSSLFKEYLSVSIDSAPGKTDQIKKLVYISIILIFIAHATIHEAQSQAASNIGRLD